MEYDAIAIGAGTGGLTVTRLLAKRGLKVALVERDRPGGDCLYTGCVPTKSLIHSARLLHQARNGRHLGVVANDVALDFAAVRAHVRKAQDLAGRPETPEAISSSGVHLVRGEARFTDAHSIEAAGQKLQAKYFVIATGGQPAVPEIPGLREAGFDTNVEAVDWETLPASLGIIGGGPIGTEFGQMMGRLGVRTTILQVADRLLERDDAEASALIAGILRGEGVDVRTGARVLRVEPGAAGRRVHFEADGKAHSFECERLLVAAGRRPELDGLALEAAGIRTNERGVVVNERLQSSQPHIFAVGDVAGGYQFTHVADAQARLVANLISRPGWLARRSQTWSDRVVPRVTYTDPEVASVGLSEAQARERYGRRAKVYRVPLDEVDRAITMGETHGFFKIMTAPGWQRLVPGLRGLVGDEIVGACLVAPHAGELLMPVVVAMRARLPMGLVAWNMEAYPTLSLGLRQALGIPFDK